MKVNIIFIFGELKFKSWIGLHKSAFQESHLLTNLLLSTYPFSKSQFCRKWEVSGRGRWSLIDPLQISKKRGMLPGVTRCCLSINLSHLLIFQDHDAHGPEFLKHMQRINAESGAKITVSMQWRLFSLGMKSFAADTYSHPICMIEIFIVFNPKSSEKRHRPNVTGMCSCYQWDHPKQHVVSINLLITRFAQKNVQDYSNSVETNFHSVIAVIVARGITKIIISSVLRLVSV